MTSPDGNPIRGRFALHEPRTVAEFHYISQCIALDEIHGSLFEAAQAVSDFKGERVRLGTIFHELTHWADLVGTNWGRRFVRKIYPIFPMLDRMKIKGMESEFWRLIDLHDRVRRLYYSDYYLVKEGNGRLGKPSQGRVLFTGGLEFDASGRIDANRPILFARFVNTETGLNVRQPVTVGALLETTATWSELSAGAELIEEMDPDEAALERKFVADEMGEMLSDPDLTLYTAPQRLVASYATVDDFDQAYRLSSAAAYIALNLDEGHFKALRPPADMSVWGDRNAAWRRNRDPAFAFAAIAIAAGTYLFGQSTDDWLNEGLSRCRLPEAAKIRATALGKMEREVDGGAGALDETLRAHLNAGLEVARARSQTDDQAVVFSRSKAQSLPLPPMVDRELQVSHFPFSTFDFAKYDPLAMHDLQSRMEREIDNFLRACR